jgi:hypothetical protein
MTAETRLCQGTCQNCHKNLRCDNLVSTAWTCCGSDEFCLKLFDRWHWKTIKGPVHLLLFGTSICVTLAHSCIFLICCGFSFRRPATTLSPLDFQGQWLSNDGPIILILLSQNDCMTPTAIVSFLKRQQNPWEYEQRDFLFISQTSNSHTGHPFFLASLIFCLCSIVSAILSAVSVPKALNPFIVPSLSPSPSS